MAKVGYTESLSCLVFYHFLTSFLPFSQHSGSCLAPAFRSPNSRFIGAVVSISSIHACSASLSSSLAKAEIDRVFSSFPGAAGVVVSHCSGDSFTVSFPDVCEVLLADPAATSSLDTPLPPASPSPSLSIMLPAAVIRSALGAERAPLAEPPRGAAAFWLDATLGAAENGSAFEAHRFAVSRVSFVVSMACFVWVCSSPFACFSLCAPACVIGRLRAPRPALIGWHRLTSRQCPLGHWSLWWPHLPRA